jgi:hypothetical protein
MHMAKPKDVLTSVRMSEDARLLRDALAERLGIGAGSVYELAIRELAAKHGITVESVRPKTPPKSSAKK